MASPSVERQILEQVEAVLQGITGASYNFDLAGDGAVQFGASLDPPVVPCVYVLDYVEPSEHGRELGAYLRAGVVTLVAFFASTDDTPRARMLDAADFIRDLKTAFEADRTLSNLVEDLRIDLRAFDGTEWDLPDRGGVLAELSVWYTDLPS